MNYSEAMEYMEKVNQLGSVPGLAGIKELCRRLGNPQDRLRFVHIAGTNGKGSTLAYISTILECAGYRVGRYISPVISDYRERFQINQRLIPKPAVSALLSRVAEQADAMETEGMAHPTSFELETAAAFLYFMEKKCDIVVLETGMGGLLDATNLITTTVVSVLASISMDHMQFLGKTLAEIAGQKAGIIKPGVPVVSLRQSEEAAQVIRGAALQQGAELIIADPAGAYGIRYGVLKQSFSYHGTQQEYKKLEITLAGTWQIENAVLAVETIDMLRKNGYAISEDALRTGLRSTVWIGRLSVIRKKPLFLVDGAHNEDAAKKLRDSIRFYFTNKKLIFIMGILRDKEYEKIAALTAPLADQIITVTTPANPRALPAYELACVIREINPHVTAVDSLEEAVEMSFLMADPDTVILAFGSLSYLGRLIWLVRSRK